MTEEEWSESWDVESMLAFVAGRDAPPGAVVPVVAMNERKVRLFLVGCCRQRWELISSSELRAVVEVAERYADGTASSTEREEADVLSRTLAMNAGDRAMETVTETEWKRAALFSAAHVADAVETTTKPHADLIRRHLLFGGSPNYVPLHPCERLIQADRCPSNLFMAAHEELVQTDGDDAAPYLIVRQREYLRYAHLLRCIAGNPFRPVTFDPRWRSETAVALAAGLYEERAFDRLPILADALEEAGCDQPDILAHCRGLGPHARGCWVVDSVLGTS